MAGWLNVNVNVIESCKRLNEEAQPGGLCLGSMKPSNLLHSAGMAG